MMDTVLKVEGLCKKYPKFTLADISFCMQSGRIMGLIGRNGAGKTTTIKSILNLIHKDGGSIQYFGKDLQSFEQEIKQQIGYAAGTVDYYKKQKIRKILDITSTFYENWDKEACRRYMQLFSLDEDKTPSELSEGMKVKFSLVLALSHGAKLLILDEPTSGLDPISRAELLDIFTLLAKRGVSVLFSTHITSDLDKCADDITYIKKGRLQYSGKLSDFIAQSSAAGLGGTLEDIMINSEKEAFDEGLA